MGGENKEIIDNNNSDFITPSFSKSEMITKLNEWKELWIDRCNFAFTNSKYILCP